MVDIGMAQDARRALGAAPDPRLRAGIYLLRGDRGSALKLLTVSKCLSSERGTAENTLPGLLEVQPAGPDRNKDVLYAGIVRQPGLDRRALVAAQVIADQVEVAGGVGRRDRFQ